MVSHDSCSYGMIFPQSVDNDRTLIVQLLAEDASAWGSELVICQIYVQVIFFNSLIDRKQP